MGAAQDIDRLCSDCASLIDHHEKIAELSAVHYNLGKTLRDVENIVALPHEAAEAEDMLRDDAQLLQARTRFSGHPPCHLPGLPGRPPLSRVSCGVGARPGAPWSFLCGGVLAAQRSCAPQPLDILAKGIALGVPCMQLTDPLTA